MTVQVKKSNPIPPTQIASKERKQFELTLPKSNAPAEIKVLDASWGKDKFGSPQVYTIHEGPRPPVILSEEDIFNDVSENSNKMQNFWTYIDTADGVQKKLGAIGIDGKISTWSDYDLISNEIATLLTEFDGDEDCPDLLGQLAEETRKEIDREMVDDLLNIVGTTPIDEPAIYAPYIVEFPSHTAAYDFTDHATAIADIEYFQKKLKMQLDAGRIEAAEKTKKQLELIDDALITYKAVRLPERKVFYVDVGDMPHGKAKEHIEKLKNEMQERKISTVSYDPVTKVEMQEDYWFTTSKSDRPVAEVTDWSYWDARAGIDGEKE